MLKASRSQVVAMLVVLGALALAGCGAGIGGKYANEMMQVEFKGGGKAYVTVMGQTSEVKYSVEGDKVILKSPAGNTVLTRERDGSLGGTVLGPLQKVKG